MDVQAILALRHLRNDLFCDHRRDNEAAWPATCSCLSARGSNSREPSDTLYEAMSERDLYLEKLQGVLVLPRVS